MVRVQPSGEAFNAISLDPVSGIPRNPMLNAGAIATAAQIWPHDPEWASLLQRVKRCCEMDAVRWILREGCCRKMDP